MAVSGEERKQGSEPQRQSLLLINTPLCQAETAVRPGSGSSLVFNWLYFFFSSLLLIVLLFRR